MRGVPSSETAAAETARSKSTQHEVSFIISRELLNDERTDSITLRRWAHVVVLMICRTKKHGCYNYCRCQCLGWPFHGGDSHALIGDVSITNCSKTCVLAYDSCATAAAEDADALYVCLTTAESCY